MATMKRPLFFALPLWALSLVSGCGHRAEVAFDVPSLVGKDITAIRATLGAPSEYTDPNSVQHPADMTEWDALWNNKNVGLLVTYNIQTGKVVDFFVSTNDPSGASGDTQTLIDQSHAEEGAVTYRIEKVAAAGHPGEYTGIKIVPN
jgi:hypothetical protein